MQRPGKFNFLRSLPKIAVGSASLLAALYVGCSPRVAPALYMSRLFRPTKYPEGEWEVEHLEGISRQDVHFFAADGSRLHGWFMHQPEAEYVVLFSHGNRGNLTGRLNIVTLLLRSNVSVLLYDYRGYGKSEGKPSVAGVCQDGIAAFDYLIREKGYKASQILLYGESLGTAIASEIAAARPCAGIILQSGFTSLRDIGAEHFPVTKVYPRFLFPEHLLDNLAHVENNKRPLLIIHGHKDKVVPFKHAQMIYERAAEPKVFVELPECAHNDIWSVSPDVFVNAINGFLELIERRKESGTESGTDS
jgi:uncharacterized protein